MPKQKEVDDWFTSYENPMKPVVMTIRHIILEADDRIDECIKWSAPTFTYKGNMASFFPKSKKHASLMFHQGAEIPGTHRLLEGEAKAGRTMKIASIDDAIKNRDEIEKVVKAWCDWKDKE